MITFNTRSGNGSISPSVIAKNCSTRLRALLFALAKLHRFLLITLFCLLFSSGAFAVSLVNGGVVSGAIGSPGEEDTYTLDLNANEFVTLSVADINNTSLAPFMRLYAPDGSFLTQGFGSTVANINNFQVPQTGIYTLVVQDGTQGQAQTGDYEVHFASAPIADEHGLLINGGYRSETITTGDLDSYTFSAGAGEFVNLSMADINNTLLAPAMRLYAPDGSFLTQGFGSTVANINNFQVPQTGIYTLVVQDGTQGQAQSGDYEVHFASAPIADEHGLLINGGYRPETITTGDLDSYTFSAGAGEFVNLSMADINNTLLAPAMRLYAPDGSFLTQGFGSTVANINNFQVPQTGIYTLVVQDGTQGQAQTGDYEVHFASAPIADEHGLLINGGYRSETITTGDLDSYTFSAGAGEFVNLSMADINNTLLAPAMRLYAPDGSFLTQGFGSTVANINNFQVPQTGIYTLVVQDGTQGQAQSGDYEVHFARAPGANELGLLVSGIPKTDTITTGDLDTFTFDALAGSLLDVSLLDTGATGLAPGFVLYSPSGEFLTVRSGSTEAQLADYQLSEAGTYTLLVQDWTQGGAQTGDYSIVLGLNGGVANSAPVANAGDPVSVNKGELVTLSGSGSVDPDGAPLPLTFDWQVILTPPDSLITTGSLSATDQITTTFTPDVGGAYILSLTVSDGELNDNDTVQVTVLNATPVADAGGDQQVLVGQDVVLDGSASSDADGDLLSYTWMLTTAPDGSALVGLTNADQPIAGFTPDVPGVYEATLIVDDGETASDAVRVAITASAENVGPTVVIDAPASLPLGDSVILDGSGSFDADEGPSPLTFGWTFLAVPSDSGLTNGDITDRNSETASFDPDEPGTYSLQLQASDGENTGTGSVEIEVVLGNQRPSADAGEDGIANVNETVFLDGSGSVDPDSGPAALAFQWRFVHIPGASLLGSGDIAQANSENAQFTPDAAGSYVLELEVDDGDLSDFDNVTVSVEGAAEAQVCEMNGDEVVDIGDIRIIMSLLNTASSGSDDPADWNRDGTINVLDARGCVLECTLTGCASR